MEVIPREALAAIEEGVDVLLTDKNLPDVGGMELLREAKVRQADAEVLIITGYASLDTALAAMKGRNVRIGRIAEAAERGHRRHRLTDGPEGAAGNRAEHGRAEQHRLLGADRHGRPHAGDRYLRLLSQRGRRHGQASTACRERQQL